MKKMLLITSFILASILANAQWYVSGSLSYEKITEKNDKYSNARLGISPQIGYYINKKMDAGLSLEFSISSETQYLTSISYDGVINGSTQKGKSTVWTIAPYLRYSIFQMGAFEILGRASFCFDIATNSSSTTGYSERESVTDSKGIGLNIGPTIQYNMSDRISLFTSFNFFHIKMTFSSLENNITEPDSYTDFGLNLNFLNMENLGLGVIYKF
jgi:hypothetical protein